MENVENAQFVCLFDAIWRTVFPPSGRNPLPRGRNSNRLLFSKKATVSLAVEKLVSLMEYHHLLFAFVSPAWEDIVKKLIRLILKSILPLFSSKSFRFSGHTFKYLTHFDFIFVYGMRNSSCLIILPYSYLFFPTTFIEETVFTIVYFCLLCHRLADHLNVVTFQGFLFHFIVF